MNKNTLLKATLIFLLLSSTAFALEWWSTDWNHRKPLELNLTNQTITEQKIIRVNIDSEELIDQEKLNYDCSDLRIVQEEQQIPIDVDRCGEDNTGIRAIINSSKSGDTYLYYNNPHTEAYETEHPIGKETEFSGNELNSELWEQHTDRWYTCPSWAGDCYKDGQPSEQTAEINKQSSSVEMHSEARAEIYVSTSNGRLTERAESQIHSKLPIISQETNTAYFYLDQYLSARWESVSATRNQVYVTDGDEEEKLYQRRLSHTRDWTESSQDEEAVYKLEYQETGNLILYRSSKGKGDNDMELSDLQNIGSWYTGELKSRFDGRDDGDEELFSVDITDMDKDNLMLKFRSYSTAARTSGTDYARASSKMNLHFIKNNLTTLNPEKQHKEIHPYLKGRINSIQPIKALTGEEQEIPINLKNKGTHKLTNVSVHLIEDRKNRNLSKNHMEEIQPKEEITINLNRDIGKPTTTQPELKVESDQKKQFLFLDTEIAYFNSTTNNRTLDIQLKPEKEEKQLKINKSLLFNTSQSTNIGKGFYTTEKPRNIDCNEENGEILNTNRTKEGFYIDMGWLNSGETKITCKYTLNPEKAGLKINKTRKTAQEQELKPNVPIKTLKRIDITNLYQEEPFKPITEPLNTHYNYEKNQDWNTPDPRQGKITVEYNETRIIEIELKKDNVITKSQGERKQNPNKTTVANGTAYTVKPIKINNTDTISYKNVSWEGFGNQTWNVTKRQGKIDLEPEENTTVYVEQEKENIITYEKDEWALEKANLSQQVWRTTTQFNNTDTISYANVSIPRCLSNLSCSTIEDQEVEPGINEALVEAKGDKIKNNWVTNLRKEPKVNSNITKDIKIETKSHYNRNFTNLPVQLPEQHHENEKWTCKKHANEVNATTVTEEYKVATFNGTGVIKTEKDPVLTTRKPMEMEDDKLHLKAKVKINNTDEISSYNNVSLPFNETELHREKFLEITNKTFNIRNNTVKRIPIELDAPLETSKKSLTLDEFPGEREKHVELSNNLSRPVKNTSFSFRPGEEHKDIRMYKCIDEYGRCSLQDQSEWKEIDYDETNGELIRRGDSMSTLSYVISYDKEEEDEDSSGGSGGSSGGGAGGSSGVIAEPEEPLENESETEEQKEDTLKELEGKEDQRETAEDEKKIERDIEVIYPGKIANRSFQFKAKVINDENCLVKLNEGLWKEPRRTLNIISKEYSGLSPGEYELTVDCRHSNTTKYFEIQDEEEKDLGGTEEKTRMTGAHLSFNKIPLHFVLLFVLLASLVIYLFRTRALLS